MCFFAVWLADILALDVGAIRAASRQPPPPTHSGIDCRFAAFAPCCLLLLLLFSPQRLLLLPDSTNLRMREGVEKSLKDGEERERRRGKNSHSLLLEDRHPPLLSEFSALPYLPSR